MFDLNKRVTDLLEMKKQRKPKEHSKQIDMISLVVCKIIKR